MYHLVTIVNKEAVSSWASRVTAFLWERKEEYCGKSGALWSGFCFLVLYALKRTDYSIVAELRDIQIQIQCAN